MPSVGWVTLDMYCDHVDCPDIYTNVRTYTGQNLAEAKRKAILDGWKFHWNGLMSCPKCRKKPKPKHSYFSEEFERERENYISDDL